MQEDLKTQRSWPWRADLRKALSNKERTALPSTPMPELHQEPSLSSLYIEDKLGFSAEQALTEARRCLDCPSPGCVEACPAHIHIPTFVKAIEHGDLPLAWHTLRERSTLSAICSRVCAHDQQCEGGCIYPVSLKKKAVAIGALERYVATWEVEHRHEIGSLQEPAPSQGKQVAIIGSGPGALAAAHDLVLMGYGVTIYERLPKAGGVMRTGIPRFRLPSEVIDDEAKRLECYGVKFCYGVEVGKDIPIDELRAQYSAIIIATGACLSNVMGIPGEEFPGVVRAGDYLTPINMASPQDLPSIPLPQARRVAIIGGGNTAMDAARTARRLGAEQVTVVYRRGMAEMPACRDEVEHALAEGIEFLTLHQVARYLPSPDGQAMTMELIEMQLTEPDESGRRRPEPTGHIRSVEIDMAVVCVGVSPEQEFVDTLGEGLQTKWGCVIVTDEHQATSLPNLYAVGDASRGGSTVVHAMTDGRRAAQAIHRQLSGQ